MSKFNIQPFSTALVKIFLRNRSEANKKIAHDLNSRGILGSGIATQIILKEFNPIYKTSLQEVLQKFKDSLQDVTNGIALKACIEFEAECLKTIDLTSNTLIEAEIKRIALKDATQISSLKAGMKYEITAPAKDFTQIEFDLLKSNLRARRNPFWEQTWVQVAKYVVTFGLGVLATNWLPKYFLHSDVDKQLQPKLQKTEQSVSKKTHSALESMDQSVAQGAPTSSLGTSPSVAQPSHAPESNLFQSQKLHQ